MTPEYGVDTPADRRRWRRARHESTCRRDGGLFAKHPRIGQPRDPRCGGSFACGKCGDLFGWCHGAADDYPDYCTFCANAEAARSGLA